MDHRLKQRLIGGAILVALGVVFLPMLLDGTGWREGNSDLLERPPEPILNISEPAVPARRSLPVSEPAPGPGPEAPVPSPAPPRHGMQTVPDPAAEGTGLRPTLPGGSAAEPRSTPAAGTEAGRPAPAPGGGWSVQVGAFEKKSGAEKLAARLRLRGYPVFIRRTEVGSKSLYRVKVGPVSTRSEAVSLKRRLERAEQLTGLVQRER